MSKHTPGPWVVDEDGWISSENGASHVVEYAGCGSHEADWNKNDLRLALSAPELLEALIEVTASLEWNAHGRCRGINDGPIMPSAMAVECAHAAIAKAKGEIA